MPKPSVLGIVLAGGAGTRLSPLTADRAKPAVPFGGVYRLIDFALSNMANGGIRKICVLTQYKSHSLDRHISTTWRMSSLLGGRHLPVHEPDQRRTAGHRDRLRRGPRVPDGPDADDRSPRGARGRGDGGGDTGPAGRSLRVRHRQGRGGRPDHRRVPGKARRPAAHAGQSGPELLVHGQLRVRHRRAGRRAAQGCRRRLEPARHRRQHHPQRGAERQRAGVRLHAQPGPGGDRPGRGLLARRRLARVLLRRPYGPVRGGADLQPVQRAVADPDPCAVAAAGQVRARSGGPDRAGAGQPGQPGRRDLRRPGPPVRALARGAGEQLGHRRALGTAAQHQDRPSRGDQGRDHRQERHGAGMGAGRRGQGTGPGPRLRGLLERHHRSGQGSGGRPVTETSPGKLRVALLTREYPPEVYGGAGVHVTYLARELAPLVDLTVHCQGADRPDAVAHRPWDHLADANQALQVVSTDLSMTAAAGTAQLVHSHTWYANLGGHLAALLYGIPHIMTMHSLEPLRPWKAEQLGGGYRLSSWCERVSAASAAAVVAVSDGMRADIMAAYPEIPAERIRVIRNGIDTSEYHADPGTDVLERHGIDTSRPYVIFVGRITRQKGVPVLLRAASALVPEAQLVLCAGQPDTPELEAEVTELVDGLRGSRSGVVWIPEMLPKREVIQLLTHATVFAIPSIYEPLGIVNLEAMACGTAVVGSGVGGIPEVVADGETGLLVPPGEPEALAEALNELIRDPDRAAVMGQAGRKRAVTEFGWAAIAAQTAALYAELVTAA